MTHSSTPALPAMPAIGAAGPTTPDAGQHPGSHADARPGSAARVARVAIALELLAVLLLGLMAGFFFAFAVDVAPAMARLDASPYIATQQWINKVVRNALFGGVYFGSTWVPFGVALAWLASRQRRRALCWTGLALLYFAAVFWLTRSINIPINDAMAQWSASAPPPDWQGLRERWNEANALRAAASALCFAASLAMLRCPLRRG